MLGILDLNFCRGDPVKKKKHCILTKTQCPLNYQFRPKKVNRPMGGYSENPETVMHGKEYFRERHHGLWPTRCPMIPTLSLKPETTMLVDLVTGPQVEPPVGPPVGPKRL